MFVPSTKNTLQIIALVLGIAVIGLTGCDTFGGESSGDGSSNNDQDYEITNDLSDRVDTTSDNATSNALGKFEATNVSFNLSARVEPPTVNGTGARATSLSSDGNNLYIGYLLLGNPFGGGIDILDAQDPTNLAGATSLQSDNTDVQAIASPSDEEGLLYAAEAAALNGADTPSRVSVIELDGQTVSSVTSRRLSGFVAKSVAVEPSGPDTGHDFHVITDENSLYRFNSDLSEETMLRQTAAEGVEFSGLATHQDQGFGLSLDGQIYTASWGSTNDLQNDGANLGSGLGTDSTGESGIERVGIGRLAAYNQATGASTQDERIFAALGHGGFAVLNADADGVKHRHTSSLEDGNYFTSVTLHGNAGGENFDLMYAARRQGILDVYKVPSGGISNGPTLIRRLYLREAFNLGSEGDGDPPSVNYALGVEDDNTVYVSGGKDGTLVLELSTADNPKAISFAAFCTTQSNYSEDDVTIEVTETNDEGEPIKINWTSETELSTVVLKAGVGMYNYLGGTSGNALSEAGDPPGPNQTPPRPCPANEDLVVKDEDV